MDTSEQYTLMCEKAEEIQNDYWSKPYEERDRQHDFCVGGSGLIGERGSVLLLRQDQLQEMLHYDNPWSFIWALGRFTEVEAASMEQLTLQFVMSQNYGKMWDGSDWVGGQ